MKPVTFTLNLDFEEEIDNAIYGEFYAHCRVAAGELPDREPGVYIQIKEGGPWIPVNDWKRHRYIATEDTIKRIARHFIEIGKHMKEGRG